MITPNKAVTNSSLINYKPSPITAPSSQDATPTSSGSSIRAGLRRLKAAAIATPAAKANQDDLIEVLLKYGKNPLGLPVLHYAIKNSDLWAVKILVENGSDLDFIANGLPPMGFAVQYKSLEIMEYLSSKGAPLTASILKLAVNCNFVQGVNFLIEKNCPLPENSGSLLCTVLTRQRNEQENVFREKIAIAKSLIRYGADCTYRYFEYFPKDGKEVPVELGLLSTAVLSHDLELVMLLGERGAPINYSLNGSLSKFDPNNPGNVGMKLFDIDFDPLYEAVYCGSEEIASYLISKGAVFTQAHEPIFL